MNATHLSVDEIIEFVSFSGISEETLTLSAKVNGHIRDCAECMERVTAFQDVYDELCRIGNSGSARGIMYKMVSEAELAAIKAEEIEELRDESDDGESQRLR